LAVHKGSEGILISDLAEQARPMSDRHSALNMATGAKILIEQVVVLVNVGSLAGRKLAAVAGSLDLSRDALRIETVELATDRATRFARREWLCARITIASGRTTTSLQRPG
jgi:hypothetical protein